MGQQTDRPSGRRLQIIGHRYHLDRQMRDVYDALARRFETTVYFVDDGWPRSADDVPGLVRADVCFWYVRFRDLAQQAAFDWGGFRGLRVMYDEDANQNSQRVTGVSRIGQWPEVIDRHNFELVIATGKATAADLRDGGVNAVWVAKAFDPARISNLQLERDGICTFGSPYAARRVMRAQMERAGLPVATFHSSPAELNDHLNRYLACVVCNMQGVFWPGIGRVAHRISRRFGVKVSPGHEPMTKNFEVAASGCAPIVDYIPELEDLGFRDGVSMISYHDFDELCSKVEYYLSRPEELRDIGAAASSLASRMHTWDHRTLEIEGHFERGLSAKGLSG